MKRRVVHIELPHLFPDETMRPVVVKHGNAVTPYTEVARGEFHTVHGASMFGCLMSKWAVEPGYTYWMLQ
jgi:hypothetical protein